MITHFRGILLSFVIQIKAVIEKIVEYEILWYSNKGQEESRVQAEIKVSFYCNQSPFGIVPDSAHSHNSYNHNALWFLPPKQTTLRFRLMAAPLSSLVSK